MGEHGMLKPSESGKLPSLLALSCMLLSVLLLDNIGSWKDALELSHKLFTIVKEQPVLSILALPCALHGRKHWQRSSDREGLGL